MLRRWPVGDDNESRLRRLPGRVYLLESGFLEPRSQLGDAEPADDEVCLPGAATADDGARGDEAGVLDVELPFVGHQVAVALDEVLRTRVEQDARNVLGLEHEPAARF